MDNLKTMDIQAAIIAHLNWQSKLVDFFYGVEKLNANDVPDHQNCDFGKWLYSVGLQEFATSPEVNDMERLHKEVHDGIKRMLATTKEERMSEAGKQQLQKFKDTCNRFIEILEQIERQVR
jgi:methyl-accepting chemotaxis protein